MIFATAINGEPAIMQFIAHPGRARKRPPMVATIQRTVADYFGMDPDDMKAETRHRAVSHPRQIAMFLARELTGHSLPQIGKFFGGRDHTTVIHAVRTIQGQVKASVDVAEEVEWLRLRLTA
jgi:chromosomal replication initiator protein